MCWRAGCSGSIKKVVEKIDGVTECDPDHSTGAAPAPPRRPPFLPGFLCVWAAAPAQNTAGCFGVSWLTA